MVVPFNNEESAQIQVKGWFHWRGLSQPNYDISLLQPDKAEFDIGTELDEERKADILSAPYYRELPDESVRGKEASWIGTFVDAHKDQLLNTDATSDRTCFGEGHAQYPNAKEFDGEEAVGFAQQFCEDIINSWDPATPIPPSVRDTADFRNASRAYKLTKTNADSHGNISPATNQLSAMPIPPKDVVACSSSTTASTASTSHRMSERINFPGSQITLLSVISSVRITMTLATGM